jgi:hypothetical protein
VKISRNSKGDAQFEVKAYVGEGEVELEAARLLALQQYRALEAEFGA